jgi:hypothetical protein
MQLMPFALSRALLSAGSSIDARIAMIAITTRSSISENLFLFFFMIFAPFFVCSGKRGVYY